jgi:hypothetical protein
VKLRAPDTGCPSWDTTRYSTVYFPLVRGPNGWWTTVPVTVGPPAVALAPPGPRTATLTNRGSADCMNVSVTSVGAVVNCSPSAGVLDFSELCAAAGAAPVATANGTATEVSSRSTPARRRPPNMMNSRVPRRGTA